MATARRLRASQRVEPGFVSARPPFGFQLAPDNPSPAGWQAAARKGEWRLVPDPERIQVVHTIFSRIDSGDSAARVAADLVRDDVPPPGGRWTAAVVRGIVRNPIYAGRLVWGHADNQAQVHQIENWLPDPPISPALFDRVQSRFSAARPASSRK